MDEWSDQGASHDADPWTHGNIPPGHFLLNPQAASYFERLKFQDWVNYFARRFFANCHPWRAK